MLKPIIPREHPRGLELTALRTELLRHWSASTSFWPDQWSPQRPSYGQCAVTAMIVYDNFGGEILRSVNEGVLHYWNRVDGIEVDLTRDQFVTWAPENPVSTINRDDVGSSGPTIAARHRQLAAALATCES